MNEAWTLNQQNRISFVMVDASFSEVSGIGDGNLTIEISKNGSAFIAASGTDTEIGNGWYSYISTAEESDTVGPVAVKVNGLGAIQQNLEYVVKQRTSNASARTYTVTDSVTGLPIEGVSIWITTDVLGNNIIWTGVTDTLGTARDTQNQLPYLDAGTYYIWKQYGGYIDDDNPDTEVFS